MFAAVLGALSIGVILRVWVPGVALAALCLALAPVRLARGMRWVALAVGGLGLSAGAPLAAWELQHRLFAALQDAGWLHPYEALWSWTVEEGDPSSLGSGATAAGALPMSAMDWLAISLCGLGALYAFVSRRLAVRTGRNSVAWPVLGFFAGPLVLPILLLLDPKGGRPRMIRPGLLSTVWMVLTSGGAIGATWLFLSALDPRPERVVATAHVNGAWVPTEPDGPTAFATAMFVAGAAMVAGVIVGGLTGLMITPAIAFGIEKVLARKGEQSSE